MFCNCPSARPQCVILQNCVWDRAVRDTGAPQGTVPSSWVRSLYIEDFSYRTESWHPKTRSDDSAIVGCITKDEESEYRAAAEKVVTWCELNRLHLRETETKEMVADLRRTETPAALLSIGGPGNISTRESTQRVSWTGLGTLKLSTGGAGAVSVFFSICWTKLRMLYESVVSWGIRLREAEVNRLNETIRKSSDVVGVEPHSPTAGREQLGQRLSSAP